MIFNYLQIYDKFDVQFMVNGFDDDEDFINFDLALDESPCQTISPVHCSDSTVNANHEEPPG